MEQENPRIWAEEGVVYGELITTDGTKLNAEKAFDRTKHDWLDLKADAEVIVRRRLERAKGE